MSRSGKQICSSSKKYHHGIQQETHPEELKSGPRRGTRAPASTAAKLPRVRRWKRPEWLWSRESTGCGLHTPWVILQPERGRRYRRTLPTGEPGGHDARWNKAVAERQTLLDPTYTRPPSPQNHRHRADGGAQAGAGVGGHPRTGSCLSVWGQKSWSQTGGVAAPSVNILCGTQ